MIHVVVPSRRIYRDIVDYIERFGAKVIVVGSDNASEMGASLPGKWSIAAGLFTPRLLCLKSAWAPGDRVLLVGWQALSILSLIRLGLLPRPARVAVMGCFVHSQNIRRIVNAYLRRLRFDGLGFIAFSRGEADNLIRFVGIAAEAVHVLLWRQELGGRISADRVVDGDFLFSGGYSNRDYDLLMRAVQGEPYRVVIVASSRNSVRPLGAGKIEVLYDLPEAEFEARLAVCRVAVLPLRSVGEACGQSVLLRVLRNGKPLIATRHEAIEDYLGVEYPGFVPPNDIAAMRAMLRRGMNDATYRADLAARIREAGKRIVEAEPPGATIHRFLLQDAVQQQNDKASR